MTKAFLIGGFQKTRSQCTVNLHPLPVVFKEVSLDCAYRLDLVVSNAVVVEIKAVEGLSPIHEAQLLTYLKLGGWNVGLLINFNVPVLKDGIKRIVLGLKE